MNKVTIIGSINVDHILQIDEFPQPGETIKTTKLSRAAGGKGANQAVASARSGAHTNFIGAVGTDDEAKFMLSEMRKNKINTAGITKLDYETTGQAYIMVQKIGENAIIINPGANDLLTAKHAEDNENLITTAAFVIAQSETPAKATIAAFKIARAAGVLTILNPAPVTELSPELLSLTDIIIPNEVEAKKLTKIATTTPADLTHMAQIFQDQGVKLVIITLGERGSFVSNAHEEFFVDAPEVTEVDPTGAGDTFIGALVAVLNPDLSNLQNALKFASHASALTVQTIGAFPAIPTKAQIDASF